MNPRKTAALLAKTPAGQAAMAEALGLKVAAGDDLSAPARVAILVPAYRGLAVEVQTAIVEMEAYSAQFCSTKRFEISTPYIHSARNKLARLALNDAKGFTHLLWLDDDMLPEPDALVRLLKHEKDIVGGLYVMRRPPHKPICYRLDEKKEFADLPDIPKEGLIEVDAVGTGIMLVDAKVMHRLAEDFYDCVYETDFWEPPYEVWEREKARRRKTMEPLWFHFRLNQHGQEIGEDMSFCMDAKDAGYSIWVDCSLRVGHLGQKAFYREDWIRPAADAKYAFPLIEPYPSMEPVNQQLHEIEDPNAGGTTFLLNNKYFPELKK